MYKNMYPSWSSKLSNRADGEQYGNFLGQKSGRFPLPLLVMQFFTFCFYKKDARQ
jgi:hypothetical protein